MTTSPPMFPDGATLPANPSGEGRAKTVLPKASARVLMPNRNQLELRASDLESLVPPGHRARIVWGYVERQDLSGLYAGIKAVEGGVGRAAIAPEILYALWLYATLEGVGHARGIARLTQTHDAYRWICGGVQVNYPTLADFRSQEGDALDELLTD
ncbi:MAG TPA: transposase, partial [Accumulibacter sp.]